MTTFSCDDFNYVAPDLALGLLAGDERGAALDHLATCASCRRHLDGLVQVADALLLFAPAVEPEIGFESRVMARITAETASKAPTPMEHRRRPWPRPVTAAVAAALIMVACMAALMTGLTRGRDSGRASAFRQQAQAADQLGARTVVVRADGGEATCQLVAFPRTATQSARLVIDLDEPDEPSGSYQVLAEPSDGSAAILVGTVALVNGHGLLTASIPTGTGPVDAVRILEGPGIVRYRATFQPV